MGLPESFFNRNTVTVARALLGKQICRVIRGNLLCGMVVETEAYVGPGDTACHAFRGKTARNEVMFGKPGHAYVYLVYGMHSMLNIVTEKENEPAAVLIRAIEPLAGQDIMARNRSRSGPGLSNGPAKLCAALAIDKSLNGLNITRGEKLTIEKFRNIPATQIQKGPRIGIAYARPEDQKRPWRFWIRNNAYVSRP